MTVAKNNHIKMMIMKLVQFLKVTIMKLFLSQLVNTYTNNSKQIDSDMILYGRHFLRKPMGVFHAKNNDLFFKHIPPLKHNKDPSVQKALSLFLTRTIYGSNLSFSKINICAASS